MKAFTHGDGDLFNKYPELQEAVVWVYFHSNISEFNRVECWGPLKDACASASSSPSSTSSDGLPISNEGMALALAVPRPCQENCECCFTGHDH